ncbi:O-6-alkylguanine-DNA alkyltransferase [Dermatophagoides farinae]|uniref:Methylated-DNA--protein-cysteine methyltransferase n=1 Tax=Dermatophagoides farinae TaxID=6954 RepID=A0A922IB09_DERFA|nr:methylated-dna--protein-cysteine methyltransferase-like [Dermatophagoides farinae]KAH9522573.1 hypothetical protein DERF_006137 [Dermatophagoides farinae]
MNCETKQINLSTPICLIELSSCTRGLHSIKRRIRLESLEQEKTISTNQLIPCYRLDETLMFDKNKYPDSLLQAIHWFRQYFSNDGQPDLDVYDLMEKSQLLCPQIQLTDFAHKTYLQLLKNVRYGQRSTYGELSEMVMGNNRGARAIGTAMKNNPLMIMIPCHRLVQKSGNIGKYGGEEDSMKQWLLDHEQDNDRNQPERKKQREF